MLVHGFAHSLEQLGLAQAPYDSWLSFKLLNASLRSTQLPSLGRCFTLSTTQLGTLDVLRSREHVWGFHVYHFDATDIDFVESQTVRQHWWKLGIYCSEHFVLVNNDTNVVYTNPEVVFMTPEEKEDPSLFLERMRKPPYQLVFDTSSCSSSNIRQLQVSVSKLSLETNYNTPRHLERMLRAATP